jgi:signal transduction histidine kinase
MKTDLITNVSHDIKTPLTSIINYVELLKRENINDEKIQGYLKILEEKAQRLKILTEDVIEASKVSSGTISFEKTNINLVEMLNQAEGEFKERFEEKGLTLISNIPDEPIVIHVDGKRMWRVIENIFNNVEKYAMPGSRVYGDLSREKQTIVYSLKNISQQPLNITAEELTERFIRGDVSRSTEGSGLGLSIAKSLTQLQGGEFRLYLDGDLFKVIIEFPACNS